MTALAPSDIRQYVYDHLDVQADEVPSTVLDIFMQDGYNRIIGEFDDTPSWLHVAYSFTTTAGQAEYDLDSYTGLTSPTPLQTIADVRGPRWSLQPVQQRQARDGWRQDSPSQGTPFEFSVWGRSLFLWPTPSSAENYTILGTRQPTDWLLTNSAPDCPEEYHRLIADYTLGRTYAQQDDPEMAQLYLNSFLPTIKQLKLRYVDSVRAQPIVVNRGKRPEAYRTERALRPPIYSWE